jgi:hypothetical protein
MLVTISPISGRGKLSREHRTFLDADVRHVDNHIAYKEAIVPPQSNDWNSLMDDVRNGLDLPTSAEFVTDSDSAMQQSRKYHSMQLDFVRLNEYDDARGRSRAVVAATSGIGWPARLTRCIEQAKVA